MNGMKLSELDLAVSGYLDHLIVDRGLARLTVDSYGSDMKDFSRFLASLGARDAAVISREDLYVPCGAGSARIQCQDKGSKTRALNPFSGSSWKEGKSRKILRT